MGISVDLVVTSNDSLSGVAARDGVTPIAGTTRVLAVAQTTTSQNGPWLVQSGAWTRPSDFNVDADYVPGQTLFVQSGTLGAFTNWQLQSGTTVAGAKTYAPIGRIAPVRAVQTAAFPGTPPGYTVGGATGGTVLTANANGALPTSVFDNVASYNVGDRLEVNELTTAGTVSSGVYSLTQIGDGSHPWILTRAADMNSNGSFSAGVAYDVTDGLRFRNRRRQLATPGPITLGTTPLAFADVISQDLKIVDLSQGPYFVQADVPVDQAPKIRQFIRDYAGTGSDPFFATNKGAVGVLPACRSYIYINSPITDVACDNITIRGAGRTNRLLAGAYLQGGHMFPITKQNPPIVYGGLGTPTKVDSAYDQPLVMYNIGVGGDDHPFFNLTHGGFTWGGRATCHVILRYRFLDLTQAGYCFTTRGREVFGDALDECFSFRVLTDGTAVAKMRIGGVIKTCTTAAAKVVVNKNYCIDLTYDGAYMKLYVSEAGTAKDVPVGAAIVAATGSITDFPWEETHLGKLINADFPEGSSDLSCANGVFGSLQITTAVQTIPALTGTTTPNSVAAAGDFYGPICSTNTAIMSPAARSDGSNAATPTALAYAVVLYNAQGWLPVRRGGADFTDRFALENMFIDCGGTGSAILFSTCKNSRIENVQIKNSQDGINLNNSSYYSHIKDVEIDASRMGVFIGAGTACTLSGSSILRNTGANGYYYVESAAAVTQNGVLSFEVYNGRAVMLCKNVQGSTFHRVSINDEGSGATMGRGVIVASVGNTALLEIHGVGSLQNPHTTFVFGSDGGFFKGTFHNGFRHQTAAGAAYVVNILNTDVTPMVRLPDYKLLTTGPAAYTNQPSCVKDYSAPALPGGTMANADSTILYSAGDTRSLLTVIATANRTTTLSATGVLLGQRWAFPFAVAQGFTWAFVNGGGGGGTLFTAPTTYIGTPEFIFDGANWKLYRC